MLYNAHRPSVVARAPEVVSARSIEETCNPACIDLDFSRFFRLSEAVRASKRTRCLKLVGWLGFRADFIKDRTTEQTYPNGTRTAQIRAQTAHSDQSSHSTLKPLHTPISPIPTNTNTHAPISQHLLTGPPEVLYRLDSTPDYVSRDSLRAARGRMLIPDAEAVLWCAWRKLSLLCA